MVDQSFGIIHKSCGPSSFLIYRGIFSTIFEDPKRAYFLGGILIESILSFYKIQLVRIYKYFTFLDLATSFVRLKNI